MIPEQQPAEMAAPAPAGDVVLSARRLGKMYRIYDRPQDRLKQMVWGQRRSYGREFWALRELGFEVRRGETLGVIGRNGSGKSTLLQLLAGTLTPTTGAVRVDGRVAALLELGSGFNPDFTGRENVFLNGAILGLSQREITRRFEEIAAFADIGAFIDQPVKLYSSGMFLRLAFAVVTTVDADVLLIDEALAVGDVFFRQKCYQRLEEMRAKGAAIILVSHAMMDVEQFCERAILLNRGRVLFQGPASEAVKRYYLLEQDERPAAQAAKTAPAPRPAAAFGKWEAPAPAAFLRIADVPQVSNGWARCTGLAICDSQGQPARTFQQGEAASFYYEFELLQDIEVPIGGVVLQNEKGIIVHGKNTLQYGADVPRWVARGSRLRFRQDIVLELAAGEYTFEVGLATMSGYHYQRCDRYSPTEVRDHTVRLCHLPSAASFAVVLRRDTVPTTLLHHGIANLPGSCQVAVDVPATVDVYTERVSQLDDRR